MVEPNSSRDKIGLVLSGGGARAAYQVGVLQGIAAVLPRETRLPFPVITGTSAGAINALGLVGRPGTLRHRTRNLATVWSGLHSGDVYHSDGLAVLKRAAAIVLAMMSPRFANRRAQSLLDNRPLSKLLSRLIQFDYIDRALQTNELEAIAVSAFNYSSGQSTTFFQTHSSKTPWQRFHRQGVQTIIELSHLLASSALPTLFPPIEIAGEFFGDGALRQARPLSPAIHLGANKLLIIGVTDTAQHQSPTNRVQQAPSVPQVLGQMLNSVFLDALQADLEQLDQVNRLLLASSPSTAEDLSSALVSRLVISPSESLSSIAVDHFGSLPKSTQTLLRMTGGMANQGKNSVLSYVLFEPSFTRALIDLGYKDAIRNTESIRNFFAADSATQPPAEPRIGRPLTQSNPSSSRLRQRLLRTIGKS